MNNMTNGKTLAIGERFNAKRWAPALPEHLYSFELRRRLGLYRAGPRRAFLTSLGITWNDGINLLWPSPILGEWDAAEARRVAVELMPNILRYSRVLLFGRRVCDAFDVPFKIGIGYEISEPYADSTIAVPLLHPSWRNRKWNDESVRETARRACATYGRSAITSSR